MRKISEKDNKYYWVATLKNIELFKQNTNYSLQNH